MSYLFGHSAGETDRLLRQARMFGPYTRRLFEDAGIGLGMKVLDVGSGAGDVSLILADMVGPSGTVIGVDINSELLKSARARADAAGLMNVIFRVGDARAIGLDHDFDAVVGRCVLFFITEPSSLVRRLAEHVRPGGVIAFQEPGNATLQPSAMPPSALLDQVWSWIIDLYARAGMDLQAGLRLFSVFKEAGLPDPQMHLDAAVGGGADWPGYEYIAGLVRTILPRLIEHGVATAEEVDVDSLADRLRTELVASRGVMTTWSFITAWSRK
ncbi:MAG TPA: methyltransferase domain-containing protein [Candidatus Dormibacteraeota bacterium]|jgi:SAM-dependent methyltransferase|nr:methyltransferase domain-containing protein [Candidatus Dormibacteraeota bacterium]